ncbi:metallophosphoesterase [Deinococcus psychrotolerans]|uniref:Metallophosphoesterase n=1 Tax=Deinococcus psychrotolerans TaxID=2489213 RepID=A0A3G8YKI6_9DEIO|nr:metallophosphoesterase [Deinococcus psychrotolerans]AZI41576.1 metallophosphoesterase [Deinococcus psychrotolerans]
MRLARSLLSVFGTTLGFSYVNAYRYRTSQQRFELGGLTRPLKVVLLSDLHYGNWIGRGSVRRWVRSAMEQRADLIVITGDFLDSSVSYRPIKTLIKELSALQAPLGVYGVFGNHDWTSLNTQPVRARFARQLAEAGITIINNAGVQLRDDFYLCGIDDWWFGNQDLQSTLQAKTGGGTLMLSHNPDFLPHVPEGVGLTLCGHTHGGQIKLPFLGPVKQASLYGTRFLEGWVQTQPEQPSAAEPTIEAAKPRTIRGFVTHGLGVTGLPLRLNCPAELVVFDLQPPAENHTPVDPNQAPPAP